MFPFHGSPTGAATSGRSRQPSKRVDWGRLALADCILSGNRGWYGAAAESHYAAAGFVSREIGLSLMAFRRARFGLR